MLRLDHVWAWRLVSDENQRPLPQRRAGSPNFLLQLGQLLLGGGWGPGRKGSAEDSQGTQETVSTEVKDAGEVVSPETGAGAGPSLRGPAVGTPCLRGWPSGLWAPEELVLSRTGLELPDPWSGGLRGLEVGRGVLGPVSGVAQCPGPCLSLQSSQRAADQDQPWPLSPGEGWGRSRPSKSTGDF